MLDEEFQYEAREQRTNILAWWKEHYNYSRNDETYKTVTELQVYEDRLEYILRNYNKEIGSNKQAYWLIKNRALDKNFDQKYSDNTKQEIENLFKSFGSKK